MVIDILRYIFRIDSLRGRIMYAVVICFVLSIGLSSVISYNTLSSLRKNKVDQAIINHLQFVTRNFEQDYMFLLQVSEQMVQSGAVGREVQLFYNENDPYLRSVHSRQISETMNLVLFSNTRSELALYLNEDSDSVYYQNLPIKRTFNLEDIDALFTSSSTMFHPIHQSISRTTNSNVLSIKRNTDLDVLGSTVIYAEVRIDTLGTPIELETSDELPLYYLQLNSEDIILYSELPDSYFVGTIFNTEEEIVGSNNDYIYYSQRSNMGFTSIILLPKHAYNFEISNWFRYTILFIFACMFLIFIFSVAVIKWAYRPIINFVNEMEKVGAGDLSQSELPVNLSEFKHLYNNFNDMKFRLGRLIEDGQIMEKEKHKLELDMIYYKINPHFIMNSLNSIKWLSIIHKCPDVEEFSQRLIYILGYSLGKIDQNTSLETEIRMTDHYIQLMRKRYDFTYELHIQAGEYLKTPVARLLVQPIVENAIQHGLIDDGLLSLSVELSNSGEFIRICCYNDGRNLSDEQIKHILSSKDINTDQQSGLGLSYVRIALGNAYGDKATLSIDNKNRQGTTVVIQIPLERRGIEHV